MGDDPECDTSSSVPVQGYAGTPKGTDLDTAFVQELCNLVADELPSVGSADLLRQVIEDAERSCERLRASPAGSEETWREAHALQGTAGLFGLGQISTAAGELQKAARAGGDVSGPVERLREAVAVTRAELREAGLLAG